MLSKRASLALGLLILACSAALYCAQSDTCTGTPAAQQEIKAERTPGAMADVEPKDTWPELVGKTKEEAQAVLTAEAPDATVQFVLKDSMVTMDYRTDRVRVFMDGDVVASAPRRG